MDSDRRILGKLTEILFSGVELGGSFSSTTRNAAGTLAASDGKAAGAAPHESTNPHSWAPTSTKRLCGTNHIANSRPQRAAVEIRERGEEMGGFTQSTPRDVGGTQYGHLLFRSNLEHQSGQQRTRIETHGLGDPELPGP
jgi:hypothetical protein